ncbi:hypothetical protein CAPTEDRAFT_159382 [Capitella teleta]|uniref:Ribosomal RNA-processing protein 42 n=1 Tax=Capitella teleta TaxID=283909 RepID=R7T790_CAPTE|nr:hypothetical protein CAPTEDRAFT_159382 [Capitella teleta]|eukprot:ELT89253.1 hypothetical protein CAPTEDRAFT_159382 [Capitella teleta]
MAEILLSEAEKTFILHGVQDGLRQDGRTSEDYRCVEIETNVVSNSNGSSRVRMANTDILVGVKAEIVEPETEQPKNGRVEFFVDCSANATPAFEGRGGEDLATEIASLLDLSVHLDLEALCIISGKQCWLLYVDVLILECGGNLFDAVALAVKSALHQTRIPLVTVSVGERGEAEIELSDDPFDCKRVGTDNVPCLVTLNKIGLAHVVDACLEEEACSLAKVVFGVTENGSISSMRKIGSGSLDPNTINDMIQSAKRVGLSLNDSLAEKLKEEELFGDKKTTKGFLR